MVWYTLDRLSRADLLEEKWQRPAGALLSRRRMVKLGLGSLVGVAMVTSLEAPAAAQATTVVASPQSAPRGQCETQDNPLCVDQCCTATGQGNRRLCIDAGGGDLQCVGALCVDLGGGNAC